MPTVGPIEAGQGMGFIDWSILFAYIAVAVGIEVRRTWTHTASAAPALPRAAVCFGGASCDDRPVREQVWVHKNKEGGKDTESFFVAGRTLPWSPPPLPPKTNHPPRPLHPRGCPCAASWLSPPAAREGPRAAAVQVGGRDLDRGDDLLVGHSAAGLRTGPRRALHQLVLVAVSETVILLALPHRLY